MLIKPKGAALVSAKVEPTSLLKLVAGEYALRVAALWPAPHTPFVTAPSARRHLVCLALALGRDVAVIRDGALTLRLKRAIPALLGAAPQGLPRALGRLGDLAWPADAYVKLLDLLAEPRAAKALRHAEALDAELVRRMAELPASLADGLPLSLALVGQASAVLCEAYAAIGLRSGPAAAEAAARRWVRAASRERLAELVRDDLYPEPAAPPHPGTARLKPLASKAAIREAASRFRNCLRDNVPYAASGWSAYYEWEGPPGVVVEVTRDAIFGWRLEQARTADNGPVPEPLRDELTDELALIGVHVGRSSWELERAIDVLTEGSSPYVLYDRDLARGQAFGG